MRRLFATILLLVPVVATAEDRGPIVAVFDVEAVGLKLPPSTIESLSAFLTAQVAASGRFRVVPRDRLKARIFEAKKRSYKECYAQSCQIELGQELAAEKTISAQVVKVGSSCAATLSIFDLTRATTEGGSSAKAGCTDDEIVAALEAAVDQLVDLGAPSRAPVPAPGPAAATAPGAPSCDQVCDRFVSAMPGSQAQRAPIRRGCMERCRTGDSRYQSCAWTARSEDDVKACEGLSR